MANYVLLTKISPESMTSPEKLKKLEQEVMNRIKKHCPEVKWISNYAVLGPYDYLDIFEAPDDLTAGKVATIIRSFGHATTETWNAIPWDRFRGMLGELAA
ncbi:MAG: GYD domain-containing protein [Candidatus Manganitrophus sp. SA1]|nr:GYD domain-containing protein [Candidatus Manganitrophus morganii]